MRPLPGVAIGRGIGRGRASFVTAWLISAAETSNRDAEKRLLDSTPRRKVHGFERSGR